MRQLKVRDIMRTDPAKVTPSTPLKSLAGILVDQGAGAVPVVSLRGAVIGVVTQFHLLRKEELRQLPDGRHGFWRSYGTRRPDTAETVGEVMTRNPVTVRAEATVAEAAMLLDHHQAGCLPVTDDNESLVGVVTPRELLKVFLRPDEEIRADVAEGALRHELGVDLATVKVTVRDGVAKVSGEVQYKTMLPLVLPAIRAVDGVIDAVVDLDYAIDDTEQPRVPDIPY